MNLARNIINRAILISELGPSCRGGLIDYLFVFLGHLVEWLLGWAQAWDLVCLWECHLVAWNLFADVTELRLELCLKF